MDRNPKFTPIDLTCWNRGQTFWYFSKMAPTGYSLTVDLDITHMKAVLKENGFKFFPAYLWLVTRLLNKQQEFKIAEVDGQIGYYDTLTPLYATFHEDDKTFSLLWTEYDNHFPTFHDAYIEHQQKFGHNHGILARPGEVPPPNAYTISCVPWISFRHFAVHTYDNKSYYFPSVEAGKFYEKDGRLMMPLSLTCHHAATDGYHIHRFLEELQTDMNIFEIYLPDQGLI